MKMNFNSHGWLVTLYIAKEKITTPSLKASNFKSLNTCVSIFQEVVANYQ